MDLKSIWTVRVTHDYFYSQRDNWGDITPTRETELTLRRRGIIFRRMSNCEWAVIQLPGVSLNEDDVLEFDFTCTDKNMVHNTIWNWNSNNICRLIEVDARLSRCIDMSTIPGEWIRATNMNIVCKLQVPLGRIDPDSHLTTELHFTSRSYYLEYWLIPRDRILDRERDFVLEVEGADIQFNRIEHSNTPLNVPAVKFRTTSPLKLTERGVGRISLCERISADVKRPILRILPQAEPGRMPFDSADTVITVAYF